MLTRTEEDVLLESFKFCGWLGSVDNGTSGIINSDLTENSTELCQ